MKLQLGCNYHTTWQAAPSMRFVLAELKGDKARLTTRTTGKSFWTNISDLIFIESKHNKYKAKHLRKFEKEFNVASKTNNWVEPVDLTPEKTASIVKILKVSDIPY